MTRAITLRRRLRGLLGPGIGLAFVFSTASSLLILGVPIYSMQLFDRVVPTGHIATLLLLSAVLVLTIVVWGILEGLRAMLMARLATRLGDRIGAEVIAAAGRDGIPAGLALRDLDLVRQTICGPAVQAIAELPWLPIGLIVLTALHPLLGLVALLSAIVLGLLSWWSHRASSRCLSSAHELAVEAHQRGDAISRSADLVRAMGMLPQLLERFRSAHRPSLLLQQQAQQGNGWIGGLVRCTRLLVQSAIMAVAAWLVVEQQLTAGAVIAGSILASRSLAPMEQLLGNWSSLVKAAHGLERLAGVCHAEENRPWLAPDLPPGRLSVESVGVASDLGRPLLVNVGFAVEPGRVIGVVGPSGAGKSTLCRLLAGCARPNRGSVRLAGAELAQLSTETRAELVGYLPQEPVVFAGTVAENIARMTVAPDPEQVVKAARLAGIQDMVLRLPQGYDTALTESGLPLSGGQRQRIGLARAVYGGPRLVVLDEPNASLDGPGEAALLQTLHELKERGTIVVLVTHKPSILLHADLVLVLENGATVHFGSRDEVLPNLLRPSRAA